MIFALLLGLLILGVPVVVVMGFVGLLSMYLLGFPVSMVGQRIFGMMDSFTLLAIPLFILAGEIMNVAGISRRLITLAKALLPIRRARLGKVVVTTEYLFSGISGSTVADTAAIGAAVIPEMRRDGYTAAKATGVVCGACAAGMLVPPSITMIVYGGVANVSIGALFAAGFIPALFCALAMMVHLDFEDRRGIIKERRPETREPLWPAFKDSGWALGMPLIIIVGILSGVFTATEAGVVAVIYALVIDVFVYRELDFASMKTILVKAVNLTGVVVFLIAMSSLFGWYLTVEQVPQRLTAYMDALNLGQFGVLIAVILFFLLLGMVMDGIAAVIMVVPILLPSLAALGVDPLHAGVLIVGATGVGLFTPPVGAGLFVACGISGTSIGAASRAAAPYLITVSLALVALAFLPGVATFLPELTGLYTPR
nr:TRAP transporter large permease [Natronocella acetinitrilica]